MATLLRGRRRGAERSSWRRRGPLRADVDPPLRCPAQLLTLELPRVADLCSVRARAWLHEGQAFVTPAASLLGDLAGWDMAHLRRWLPVDKRFGVHLVRDRLVMSHSTRYGGANPNPEAAAHQRFPQSAVQFSTFAEFADAYDDVVATALRKKHIWFNTKYS